MGKSWFPFIRPDAEDEGPAQFQAVVEVSRAKEKARGRREKKIRRVSREHSTVSRGGESWATHFSWQQRQTEARYAPSRIRLTTEIGSLRIYPS